jgi:hypothetical protein
MRRSSEFDLCQTSAIMSTEAVPNVGNNLPNGIAKDSHRMAS